MFAGWRGVAVLVGLVVAAAPAWAQIVPANFWILRGLSAITLAALLAGDKNTRHPLLATPGFLMLAMALVFYCLVPALVLPFRAGPPLPFPAGLDPFPIRYAAITAANDAAGYLRYVPESPGELLVLAFTGGGAAFLALLPTGTAHRENPPVASLSTTTAFALIVTAGVTYQLGKRLHPSSYEFADLCVPLVLLGMASLVLEAKKSWVMLSGCVVGSLLLMPFMFKTAVLFDATAAVLFGFRQKGRIKLMVLAGLAVAVVVGALVAGMNRDLYKFNSWQAVLYTKLVERQAETVYCLNFVLKKEADGHSPFYELQALVPRVLWPDKPSLSSGSDYAARYCGLLPGQQHSASVTLLGEPLARAGWAGLAVAAMLLAVLWSAATQGARRGGAAAVATMALTPYLVDFDQLFAMYLASSVRAAVLIAFTLAMAELIRRHRHKFFVGG